MASNRTPEEKAAWAEKMKLARAAKAAEKAKFEAELAAEEEKYGKAKKALAEMEANASQSHLGIKENKENAATENDPPVSDDMVQNVEPSKDPRDIKISELEEAIANLSAQLAKQQASQPVQIVQVAENAEKIIMRWQAEVADDNIAVFGPNGMWGQVTGKRGTVIVPKNEWSRFYTESIRNMINNRWLIVLSGMNEDERELYNCNYRQGEILDEQAFAKLTEMGNELQNIFPNLCTGHQEMVGRRIIEAWQNGLPFNLSRDTIVALNRESKKRYVDFPQNDPRRKGIFWPVIEAMNEQEANE